MTTTAAPAPPTALPVALDVRGRLADPLRRTVEGQLGWQPVDAETAALVPPAVRLVDVTGAPGGTVPTVLVVADDDPPLSVAEATQRLRPEAVVPWPVDTTGLADAVTAATATLRTGAPTTPVVRIGGAAGGVGTTTVALALAGTVAWRGRATLVASTDRVLLPDAAPTVDPTALAAVDLWARATPLPGVPEARAVRVTVPPHDHAIADPDVGVAVLDLGVSVDVDVLVCRPDAAGLAALGRTAAAAVVVVGDGAVPGREMTAAVGGRGRVDVAWSARVARAAVVGRVPAGLPGRLIRSLVPLVPAGDRGG